LGIDIDGTLTIETKGWVYADRKPNLKMIKWVNKQWADGHYIELFTCRFPQDEEVTRAWLKKWRVKYNNIIFGKPKYDLYVGDEVKTIEEVLNENINKN
jgi:uncharacterized HAD superfamily protein